LQPVEPESETLRKLPFGWKFRPMDTVHDWPVLATSVYVQLSRWKYSKLPNRSQRSNGDQPPSDDADQVERLELVANDMNPPWVVCWWR